MMYVISFDYADEEMEIAHDEDEMEVAYVTSSSSSCYY